VKSTRLPRKEVYPPQERRFEIECLGGRGKTQPDSELRRMTFRLIILKSGSNRIPAAVCRRLAGRSLSESQFGRGTPIGKNSPRKSRFSPRKRPFRQIGFRKTGNSPRKQAMYPLEKSSIFKKRRENGAFRHPRFLEKPRKRKIMGHGSKSS
jgi:hypothetical protein